jgi:hypothetical protein
MNLRGIVLDLFWRQPPPSSALDPATHLSAEPTYLFCKNVKLVICVPAVAFNSL